MATTNATVIQDAILCNEINNKSLIAANNGISINRAVILSNYTKETIDDCWESLSTNIIQNYQRGKGTIIKGFGTFTFKKKALELEGMNIEYFREKREEEPVFIVSKELNRECMPGEYTRMKTIRFYNQKENRNIPIVKVNYSEIAYRMSMSKDEVENILSYLIKNIGESISKGEFKNKIMPNLGVLFCKYKIIAMKFDEDFIFKKKEKNEKIIKAKKNIFLKMDTNPNRTIATKKFRNTFNSFEELKSTNALNTKLEKSGYEYLNNNYSIDISKIPQHELRNIYNSYEKNTGNISFINDFKEKTRNNENNSLEKSPLLNLDEDIINTIEYYKGILILNSKKFDLFKSGIITKEEAINAILHSNINIKIDYNIAKEIVDYYNKTGNVEYMKFIAQMMKDVKDFINSKKDESLNKMKSFEIYSPNRATFYNTNNNLINSGKIKNKLNKSCYNDFHSLKIKSASPSPKPNYRILNKIKKINKNENSNLRYIREETKGDENIINSSINDDNIEENINPFEKYQNIEHIKSMISNIKILLPELKLKYTTSLTQNISSNEFINILKKYDIAYPKNDIENLLIFIGISDLKAFSIEEFLNCVKSCKIIETSIKKSDLPSIMKVLKDIIFVNGGITFLFNNKNSINCESFIKALKDKTEYDYDILKNVFYYLVKSDREFTIDDYFLYFENDKKILNEEYYIQLMKVIITEVNNKHLTSDEYFNHLLSYNISTKDKYITRINWIKYLKKERINFSAKDSDNLFLWIDTKKDNLIDIDEFVSKCNYTTKPLTVFQDIIYCNKLDIEDLAHRMNINTKELENYDYETFKAKIKKVEYTLSEEFIKKIFNEFCKKDEQNDKDIMNSQQFLKEIDYKKEDYYSKNKYFTSKYKESIIKKINHDDLKNLFEKRDNPSLGTLPKVDYVSVISKIVPEFSDDDHMKFVRISDACDHNDNVIYSKILNIIYFYTEEKLNDGFTHLCEVLSRILLDKCENDVEKLMYLIDIGVAKKSNRIIAHKPLTATQISNYLLQNYKENIPEKIILKLDIDSDGLISFEDLKSVLKRYSLTSYFKYDNNSNTPNINLFSKETLPDIKMKSIIKKLYNYMKQKNISETGLFKKLDKNNDGLISSVEFNEEIDDIIQMSPAIKDQFFNFLDFYHNGMVDLATFISRLSNMDNERELNYLAENNNFIENEILKQFKKFILKNNNLSDNEIFEIIDKDCDGLININDFQNFVINYLEILQGDFNKANLERVMMSLSLSKNLQIGINDIREFINLSNEVKEHMNLKEVFKINSNQNLSDIKKNKEWTNDIIERFGMFISEKYDSIEQFFNIYSEPGTGKFKYEDFLRFQKEHYELFHNGFNLTNDEILSIYTSLDSQKKNYLTLEDLKNKLQIFNFYTKMHIDIKNFIQQNFLNGVDAFKFFMKPKNVLCIKREDDDDEENKNEKRYYLTLKEMFDAFENCFPKKYATDTILKYLNKYFNITIPNSNNINLEEKKDTINYDEFNYIYFDKIDDNNSYLHKKSSNTKLLTNRIPIFKKLNQKNTLKRSSSSFYYSNLFKKKFENLSTPFDEDPLNKIKRIIFSSKYNLNKFFEKAALESNNNQLLVNKYQFRSIIKSLNIGITNIEIDKIISKCGKMTYDGKINLREFIKFLRSQNQLLEEGKNNISNFVGELKSLIYKYYSNPIICFQNNDIDHTGKIDFEKFKNIIFDMYIRNKQQIPNFILIKNAYDTLDLRKDGIIDIKEWCIAFASYNGKLDPDSEKIPNGQEFFNGNNSKNNHIHNRIILREWETSGDIMKIYLIIYKNRKLIKDKIYQSDYIFNSGDDSYVQADNLLKIIRELFPKTNLSQTQWKMIISIAQNENNNNLIDIEKFFRLLEITTKNLTSHPKIKFENKMLKSIGEYSGLLNEKKIRTIEQNYSRKRKFSSMTNIHKQRVNMVNLVNFGNVVLPNENNKKNILNETIYSKPLK